MKKIYTIFLSLLLIFSALPVHAEFWAKQSNGQLYTNSGNGLGNAIINVAGCNGCPGGGGGSINSINADSTAAQLITVGSAGTNFAISNPGGGSHVINLPTASAVNTGKLSAADWSSFNSRVLRSGDTMSGTLDMGNNFITNLLNPVNPLDAANKSYVDSFVTGLSWKIAVTNATTAPLPSNVYANGASGVGATLTATANGALPAIDGISNLVGQRILVKNEAASENNGIYTITDLGSVGTKYVLTRATDNDQSADMTSAAVFVSSGTVNASMGYTQTNPAPTMGVTAINWILFSSSVYTAGSGLSLTANVFSLNVAHSNNWTAAQIFDSGDFQLQGSTSGIATISAANTTTSYAVKWPSAQGAAATFLRNDGAGNLSWTAVSGAVTSVSNSDGTLTISPTTGAVVASLALGHANTWTGQQTFSTASPIISTLATNGGVLWNDGSGLMHQTAAGTSGQVLTSNGGGAPTFQTFAGGVSSVSNADGTLTISPTTGAVVASIALTKSNTWTPSAGTMFQQNAIATTPTDAVLLQNTTASIVGVPVQISPALEFKAHMFQAIGAGSPVDRTGTFRVYEIPSSGNVAGTNAGVLQFDSSRDGVYTNNIMSLGRTGLITSAAGYTASGGSINVTLGGVTAQNSIQATDGQGIFGREILTGTNGGAFGGQLFMFGVTSGNFNMKVPAAVTTYGVTLPAAQGTGALTNDGAGLLSWTPAHSTRASADLTAQTATVASVTTFTPSAAGQYEIGAYANITAISAGTLILKVAYTDENGASQTQAFFPIGLTSANLTTTGADTFPNVTIRSQAGSAITITATFTGVSITYDVGGSISNLQ